MGNAAAQISRRRWSALALIVTAQFMVILDIAIVNVALPSIKSDLHFSTTSLQWVISAYAILFGGVLLLGGRLADLLGRRRLFIVGVLVFAASSLLCGLAWSAPSLIAFRAVQGLGGALMAPAALSLLVTTFAEGRERNLALGIYGAASGSGAAAGVLLGGVITSYAGWSWIFFINVPVGIAAAVLAPVLLRESRADLGHRHFDIAGAVTITSGLMLLVYALTRATTDGWGSSSTLGAARRGVGARRRLRRDRASRVVAAAAAAHLPVAHDRRGERDDGDRRSGRVLGVLHPHAVPAERLALLGCAERRRVRRVRGHGRGDVEHRTVRRRTRRHPCDARGRPVAVRRLGCAADSPAGARPLLLEHLPGLRARRSRHGLLLRADHDRQPDGRRARRRRRGLRPDQHEPADRRRDRTGRDQRDRDHADPRLRAHAFRECR